MKNVLLIMMLLLAQPAYSLTLSGVTMSGVSGGVPFLGGFDKRITITIDKDLIDTSNLTNFPVMVYISVSSGIGETDVSCVFDELASDANRKKIAFTTSDGTTQLYAEIELWDDSNEKAWLHVKKPTVSYSSDTILYLYYDKDHADNTTYIGDTTDSVTHNVWDSNFKAVYHLAQDPNGDVADAIKDSTDGGHDMTPVGSMTTADLVDGKVGKAIDFDGSDDWLKTAQDTMNFSTSGVTLEAIFKSADLGTDRALWFRQDEQNSFTPIAGLHMPTDGKLQLIVNGKTNTTSSISLFTDTAGYDDGTLRYVAGSFYDSGDSASIYINGSPDGSVTSKTVTDIDFGLARSDIANWHYTNDGNDYYPFNGVLDEIRISDAARSASWIKATYNSLYDSLVTFGSEETGD